MMLADLYIALLLILKSCGAKLNAEKLPAINGPTVLSFDYYLGNPKELEAMAGAVLAFSDDVAKRIEEARWQRAKIAEQQALREEAVASGVNPGGWIPTPQNTTSEQREVVEQALAKIREDIEARSKAQRAEYAAILARRKELRKRFYNALCTLRPDNSSSFTFHKDLTEVLPTTEALDRAEEMIGRLEKHLSEELKVEADRKASREAEAKRVARREALYIRYASLSGTLQSELSSPDLLRKGASNEDLTIAEEEIARLEERARQPKTFVGTTDSTPQKPKKSLTKAQKKRLAERTRKAAKAVGGPTAPESDLAGEAANDTNAEELAVTG